MQVGGFPEKGVPSYPFVLCQTYSFSETYLKGTYVVLYYTLKPNAYSERNGEVQ